MPRPTITQFAYGSSTVVLTTLAVLLAGARSGAGVTAAAAAGLVLGLTVALAVGRRDLRRTERAAVSAPAVPALAVPAPAVPAPAVPDRVTLRRPRPRLVGGGAENRVGEHSLQQ